MGLLRTPPPKVGATATTPKSLARPAPGEAEETSVPVETTQPMRSPPVPAPVPLPAQAVPADILDADAGPSDDVGNVTAVSVTSSHAFVPRKPGVMRSPPAGASVYPPLPAATSTSLEPATSGQAGPQDDAGNDDEMSMTIDEWSASTQRTSTPTRQPVGAAITPSSRPIRPARAAPTPVATTPAPPKSATTITPAPPRQQAQPAHAPAKVADADASTVSEAGNDTAPDMTFSSIPPPPDSPPRQISSSSAAAAAAAFITPKADRASKTPAAGTKRKAAEVEPVPADQADSSASFSYTQTPAPRPEDAAAATDPEADYGRRWKMSNDTLRMVTERVVKKWTAQDLKKSLPTLAEQVPRGIESIHRAAVHNLQANITTKAQTLFEHYRMGRSLQTIDRVVFEGDEYEKTRTSDDARPDAWRSDLSPEALTAAMNLQMYDEAWTRLRTEYLELHEDSRRRYASILAKQAQLKELEGSVSDGVVELEKTIKLLDGFPNEDMMAWMEDTVGRVGGARDA